MIISIFIADKMVPLSKLEMKIKYGLDSSKIRTSIDLLQLKSISTSLEKSSSSSLMTQNDTIIIEGHDKAILYHFN